MEMRIYRDRVACKFTYLANIPKDWPCFAVIASQSQPYGLLIWQISLTYQGMQQILNRTEAQSLHLMKTSSVLNRWVQVLSSIDVLKPVS